MRIGFFEQLHSLERLLAGAKHDIGKALRVECLEALRHLGIALTAVYTEVGDIGHGDDNRVTLAGAPKRLRQCGTFQR